MGSTPTSGTIKIYALYPMKEDLVLWWCKSCGYCWKGKTPYKREVRPYCPRCGSWKVKVKDWLRDEEKWKEAREIALKRAGYRCEVCGRELSKYGQVHHIRYEEYYNPNNLVALCTSCHNLVHKRSKAYKCGKGLFIIGWIIFFLSILFTPFIYFAIGARLIIFGYLLMSEVLRARKLVKKVVNERPPFF